jgi:hypothetical protein
MRSYLPYRFGGGPLDATAEVPSFIPQLQSLGSVIDSFAAKHMAAAREQRAQEAQEAKDRYYQGKIDEGERRDRTRERGEWAKHNAAQQKAFLANPGAGSLLLYDMATGELLPVQPRFLKGSAPSPLEPRQDGGQAPPGGDTEDPFEVPQRQIPGSRPSPFGLSLRPMPQFEDFGVRRPEPPAVAPASGDAQVMGVPPTRVRGDRHDEPEELFVDQVSDGQARVLRGDDPNLEDVPAASLPSGAHEGQRFVGGQLAPPLQLPNLPRRSMPAGPLRLDRPDTYFVDEINDGTVQALPGPEEEKIQDLPKDAFPPGAREGQRFAAEDVGEDGRKGNPFGEALPPEGNMDFARELMGGSLDLTAEPSPTPRGDSGVTAVPPTVARGELHDLRKPEAQPQGDRWVVDLPGGGQWVVDKEAQRQARAADVEGQLRQVDEAMRTEVDPGVRQYLARRAAALQAQMPEKAIAQMQGFGQQTGEREGAQAFKADQASAQHGYTLELEDMRQKGRIALQQAKRKGGGGMSGAKIPVTESADTYIDIPRTKQGRRPDILLKDINTEWNSFARDAKLGEQLKGYRRIEMAAHNVAESGPDSGVVNVEAAFNYLGAIRGGVPVENETKEMLTLRRTYAERFRAIMVRAGLGQTWDGWVKKWNGGGELSREEVAQAMNVMAPTEKARITKGISETYEVMTGQVQQSIEPFVSQFANLGGPGGKVMRQHAVSLVNARLRAAGLQGDYNPFDDTATSGQGSHWKGKASPRGAGDASPAPAAAPAQPTASPGLEAAFQELIRLKQKSQVAGK